MTRRPEAGSRVQQSARTIERIRTAYSDHVHREAKVSLLPPKVLGLASPPLPQVQERPIIQTASFLSPGPASSGVAAMRQTKTTLIAFETAPFPYDGTIARTDQPFMNISRVAGGAPHALNGIL